jgi:ERCC4-type nuclease
MASGRTGCKVVTFCRGLAATLDPFVLVTADVREIPSGLPKRLEELGVTVVRRRLTVGDYVVGPSAVVERKTVFDLHTSLLAARLWRQIGHLRVARWPYLLVEGLDLESGPVAAASLRGLWLAASDLGITVLRSKDRTESSEWLRQLAVRRQEPTHRDRPAYAQRFRRPAPHPAEAALAAAPGISVVTRALLAEFGSVRNLVIADPADWQSVPGSGPQRSESLRHMVHDEWRPNSPTSHSDVSRNGHRAT